MNQCLRLAAAADGAFPGLRAASSAAWATVRPMNRFEPTTAFRASAAARRTAAAPTTGGRSGKNATADGVVLTLGRPKFELPLFIASLVGFATAWWLIWIDPSTQSHYPIDTSCSDWSFDGPHSTSGVYITTWTRPRTERVIRG